VSTPEEAAYQERRKILDALDLPDYLQPLQNAYWEKRREFRKLEEACLTMVEACLELDRGAAE
jgi:hypothetical protein